MDILLFSSHSQDRIRRKTLIYSTSVRKSLLSSQIYECLYQIIGLGIQQKLKNIHECVIDRGKIQMHVTRSSSWPGLNSMHCEITIV